MTRFAGQVAFITGGAMGFGRAFAEALGREGAAVVLADLDEAVAQETAAALRAEGIDALAVTCDVADESQVEAAIATTVAEHGGIDILINNAGLHLTKYNQPFSVLDRADVRALFDVNVMGVVNCTVAAAAAMKERGGGRVVNIASMASNGSTSPYGVSKLAVRGLTIAFAHELAASGIRCNAISPGLIRTANAIADLPQELVDSIVHGKQLIPRLGEIDDIVTMMLYLCSDDSSFITGETFRVSGGMPLSI
ncbi:SDR family NAD(P)-dependent oxidoreductase [Aeromicrobium yanjiei]|uniref:SDR family oxidoreductase n=1 Tax=Aeromicrobium yanjiei TaxID=2662028 RepID=A0A5Q2MIP7_9ACTN|nr:SDR family oxidoreductase [Aeromicrobium yanjiei]QGG41563.1 SDR family oxidoreductase [Aeromicrobium yanjiei]